MLNILNFKDRNVIKRNSGFTLIELLVVITIVAILALAVFLNFQDENKKARNAIMLDTKTKIIDGFMNKLATSEIEGCANGMNEVVLSGSTSSVNSCYIQLKAGESNTNEFLSQLGVSGKFMNYDNVDIPEFSYVKNTDNYEYSFQPFELTASLPGLQETYALSNGKKRLFDTSFKTQDKVLLLNPVLNNVTLGDLIQASNSGTLNTLLTNKGLDQVVSSSSGVIKIDWTKSLTNTLLTKDTKDFVNIKIAKNLKQIFDANSSLTQNQKETLITNSFLTGGTIAFNTNPLNALDQYIAFKYDTSIIDSSSSSNGNNSNTSGTSSTDNSSNNSGNNSNNDNLNYTPENCFTFSNGTITDFNSSCGENIIIPPTIGGQNVTTIGGWGFWRKGLVSVVFPSTITTIGMNSFYGNNFISLNIPSSVTNIEEGAFGGMSSLTSVNLSEGLTTIGIAVFANSQITSIVIPNSVTTIGNALFQEGLINKVTIGNGVTIGDWFSYGNSKFKTTYNLIGGTFNFDSNTSEWIREGGQLGINKTNVLNTLCSNPTYNYGSIKYIDGNGNQITKNEVNSCDNKIVVCSGINNGYIIDSCDFGSLSIRSKGNLYNFNDAQNVCSSGYKMPTIYEWGDIISKSGYAPSLEYTVMGMDMEMLTKGSEFKSDFFKVQNDNSYAFWSSTSGGSLPAGEQAPYYQQSGNGGWKLGADDGGVMIGPDYYGNLNNVVRCIKE